MVNAIEIIGRCQADFPGTGGQSQSPLPDAKVVTVTQIVQSQQKVNGMMSNLSLMFLVIIVFVGGASIANYMYANVFERRREIGTLMALGADSRLVLKVFLLKALLFGGAGGIGGYVLGTIFAFVLGPQLAGIRVCRCRCWPWRPSSFLSALRWSRVTSLPGARGPASILGHVPGDMIHAQDGKRQQSLSASRPDGHGSR